ncbi:hypothetical protein QJS10_CPA08g00280 [Acorus calamus]|uniref:Uncharacterized protein n=1 Tax=Acorus calamus TaxID=4465 RepID=A0AAV9EF99_ACOCL|nr:hypothetical protein QJS10_CPA08g00280 [Acorus calamus]
MAMNKPVVVLLEERDQRRLLRISCCQSQAENLQRMHFISLLTGCQKVVISVIWMQEVRYLSRYHLLMKKEIQNNFPRTLEALILHALSPVGAEVLTRKFDKMDQQISKEKQSEFYQLFYGVFDDQFAAMEAILNGKETFAFQKPYIEVLSYDSLQAFRNVMDQYLGIGCCILKGNLVKVYLINGSPQLPEVRHIHVDTCLDRLTDLCRPSETYFD